MTTDTVQEIKDRLSIVDVVSPYVKLTVSGKYHKGLSPFTKEKTPSFFVSPDKGLYHCFSTGKGGDMFTFIEEMEGVDFKGALKLLADKAGVEIVQSDSGSRDRKEKVYQALSTAEDFFKEQLETHPPAKTYLTKRNVSDTTRDRWSLGYAPNEWRTLSEHFQKTGVDEAILLDAGLLKKPHNEQKKEGEKKPYDTFRGRIMFPIRDIAGKTVGFSGRLFDEPKGDVTLAKYLNSPETIVFDKSRVLYGLDFARQGIRKYNFAILVEGQFDLLLAHQAGYTNAVALSGTSFTEAHARLLKRYSDNLVIAFDGDRAGVAAAGRAAHVALPHGLNVKIAQLPNGEDPADTIARDGATWKQVVKDAQHVVQFYINHIKDAKYDSRAFKLEVSRVVLPYIERIENAIDKNHFVQVVASELSVPESAVLHELEKLKNSQSTPLQQQPRTPNTAAPESVSPQASKPFMSRADILERLVFGILFSLKEDSNETLAQKVHTVIEQTLGNERAGALAREYEREYSIAIEGDLFLETISTNGAQYDGILELLDDFKKEVAREEYRSAVQALKTAERAHDDDAVADLLQKVSTLARELENR